jgi:hypothetical protein
MRTHMIVAAAQFFLLTQAEASRIAVDPAAIAVVLPSYGSKQVPVSVSFGPSPNGYTYRVFLSSDPQCLNASTVPGMSFAEQSGQIPVQGQFEDFALEFVVTDYQPGDYSGTFCVTIQGSMIISERDAVPITLEISDDALFVNGFER